MKRPIQTMLGLACGAVLLYLLPLTGVSTQYEALLERQVQYRYIDEALSRPEQLLQPIRWEPETRPLVREINDTDRRVLERRLGDAWVSFALAQETGETAMLADWFGGSAQTRAQRAADTAFREDTRMVVLRQTARPSFYHLDGSIMQLETDALTVRYAADADGLAFYELGVDHNRSTLVNRATGWHIASHERMGWTPEARDSAPRSVPLPLVGVNYYPAETPWRLFWPNYDPATIGTDFDHVTALGGNAVRVFLPEEDFRPGSAALETNLAHLQDLLDQAEARGLHVIPTLFDLKHSYATSNWNRDVQYLDAVLPVLATSPAVALIDLKNEPDLDFEAHGEAHVLAWLLSMTGIVRRAAPETALTIGWASAEAADALWYELDAVSYHDYAPLEGTADRLSELKARIGARPVLVTEIGVTAWDIAAGVPSSPNAQDRKLAQRMAGLSDADGVMIWTLHDFPDPDPTAIGASPWVRGLQSHFGLIAADGSPRPAANTVRTAFKSFQTGDPQ
ncbi:hypothetical protein FIU97_13200 [Roseivivax sp. THAF40]|uniref:hypothetical protein n=1 Tax=unclassified Roseivivax TaxID=2639302 RepID=UPI0012692278|nr:MULTISPECIES: hypothetical protein [unclassified Roseivivax]QFS83730.1 hypothetical protein FIV09_12910 [Roseivivax sp. THAF197b]QFT47532.1 hypothetical protein FIU97_13200 [Roseivivax sp. THAF40]